MRVAILGGGACGMTAAWHLARAGVDVTVLEREPRVGGLCGTAGARRLPLRLRRPPLHLAQSRALEALVRELLGDDLLLRTRSSVVLHGGRRYRYPLELDDVVRNAGLVDGGARARAATAAQRLRRGRGADVSFEDWVVHRFGRALYDAFFGPYTAQAVGHPADADLRRLGGAAHLAALARRRRCCAWPACATAARAPTRAATAIRGSASARSSSAWPRRSPSARRRASASARA